MSTEKRTVLLVFLCMAWILGAQYLMDRLGWVKPRPAAPAPQAGAAAAPAATPDPADEPDAPGNEPGKPETPKIAAPRAEPVPGNELVLGSVDKGEGYNLRIQLSQSGASIATIDLARHEAEREFGQKDRHPLRLVRPDLLDPTAPESFALGIASFAEDQLHGATLPIGDPLETRLWEVVKDDKGRVVRPLDDRSGSGQEVIFRTQFGDPAVTVTRTFRLRKGVDGAEMVLGFDSPTAGRKLQYRLEGPRGLPIEGDWYTSTFREVVLGQMDENKATHIESRYATDIVKKRLDPERFLTRPLRFAGVENQYFAVLFGPDPTPTSNEDRRDQETVAIVLDEHPTEKQKSDVSVTMTSLPLVVGPNRPVTQSYRIFAGPKISGSLAFLGAEDMASYRKAGWFSIPFAPSLARNVISPLLDRIYALTENVAAFFGGKHGSYGIAIILLTITVRMILFPLSRKQALQAKKMQEIQPILTKMKEKYKDDKERQMREHFALMKKHNVKMSTGCILGLIQLPIFVGLWQALNNSVSLRHAPFLWIDNLAAPDMLFRFPTDIPFLGRYFNILPFAVMALYLLQMHLFTPPASSPDQEQMQKAMKPVMVLMAFMFYKVPSGLGIYFITSSTWAICERLLLPKLVKVQPIVEDDDFGITPTPPRIRSANGTADPNVKLGWREKMMARLEELKQDAEQNRTIRNDKDRGDDNGSKSRPKSPRPKR